MKDGPRVLAAILAEQDTKHYGQETLFVAAVYDYHSTLLTILLSLFERKEKTTN